MTVLMRTRYYDPKLKRFLNRDVIRGEFQDGQTFNRYAYVNGNPVSYIDPLGLCKGETKGDRQFLDKPTAGVGGNPKGRNLNEFEINRANQILDDIAAQARGNASARERLQALNDHVLSNRSSTGGQNYGGWNSVYVRGENGENGVMRVIYKQTSEGIKWNIVQWH